MKHLLGIAGMFALVTFALAGDAFAANRNPIQSSGFIEMFAYSEDGYQATVPAKGSPANISGYSLRVATELSAKRIPHLIVFEDALLLLGNSGGSDEARRNLHPMTVIARYGAGIVLRRGVELRVTHGEGYDVIRSPKTTGDPWNSISLRFQQRSSDDYLEVHFYPPHNEYDPYPSGAFSQRVVARYGLQFAKRLSIPRYPRLFAFAEPLLLFGTTHPQISYTYSPRPMAVRLMYGAGFAIKPALQLRFSQGEWRSLGGYQGPTQFWNSLSLRYGW